jgi:hypothetical protein
MGGMTVLFSNTLTGMQMDYDKFRTEVNRALEHMKSKSEARSESARA